MTYSIEQDKNTARWLVTLDGRPVGMGMLNFSTETNAVLMKTALEEAYEAGRSKAAREAAESALFR